MSKDKEHEELSDKDYAELLNEINSEEQEGQEESPPELSDDLEIEARYGQDAWRKPPIWTHNGERMTFLYGPEGQKKAIEGARRAKKEQTNKLRASRLKIQREAFNQDKIPLSNEIGAQNIRYLIEELTADLTATIDRQYRYINQRVTSLLRPHIPATLRNCMTAFPDSVRRSPGFKYKASEEYGRGLIFWVTPDIPYYFEQGTEQEVLQRYKGEFLYVIDKEVASYVDHSEERRKKEVKYASTILQQHITTYYDLLKYNPVWFKTLYDRLTRDE